MPRSNPKFSLAHAQGFLLARSGLLKPQKSAPPAVAALIRKLGGIRSERMEWVHASLAARLTGYKADHLDHCLLVEKSLLRLWGVRGAELITHRDDADVQVGACAIEAQVWSRFLDANTSIDFNRRREIL